MCFVKDITDYHLKPKTFREYLLTLKTYFITKQPVKSRKEEQNNPVSNVSVRL